MIPASVITIWAGTNAAIPSGWSRETTLDGKYPKAWSASVAPNNTGGANTHSHTAAEHSHTISTHSHSVALARNSGPQQSATSAENASDNHAHSAATIAGSSGGGLAAATITWGSVNNEPPYYNVIFIKPSGGFAALSDGVCVHWNTATPPTGFTLCDGTGTTPDLRNKYLKGAANGADASAGTGGTSHSHDVGHTHTVASHTHSGTSGATSDNQHRLTGSNTSAADYTHTHTITLDAATDTLTAYTNTTAGSGDTVEVAYKKTGVIKNTSGGSLGLQPGMIALWLGATASVPIGWYICDGNNGTPDLRDKFIKVINTTGEIGNTGGANTHTHTSVSHSHTSSATHTHTGATGGPSASIGRDGNTEGVTLNNHTHTLASVSSTSPTYTTIDLTSGAAVDNQPAYRTVAYIQFAFEVGGAVLMNFI